MKYKLLITLVTLSLLVGACSAAGNATPTPQVIPTVIADNTITAEGRLEPVRSAEIAFTAGGVVSDVLFKEGEAVKEGQPLAYLGGALDTNYAAAQLQLATAQKALSDFLNSSDKAFAQAVIDLKQAKEDDSDAQEYLNYLQNSKKVPRTEKFLYYYQTRKGFDIRIKTKFYPKGPAPEVWITEAANDAALKKAKMEEAQKTYDRMKDKGVDTDQLAVLQARLDAAKAEVAAFSVLAPFDGVVADMKAKVGSSISAGEIAVTVADFSSWVVKTTDLTEIDVVKLEEGQPVTVTLDALPSVQLKGKIQSIGQTYSENQGDIVYEVTVVLTDTHPSKRWGMTANVSFDNQG